MRPALTIVAALLFSCGGNGAANQSGIEIHSSSDAVSAGGAPLSLTAVVPAKAAVDWTLSGPGSLSKATGAAVVYFPPTCVAQKSRATLTATSGAASASLTVTVNPSAAKLACVEISGAASDVTVGDPPLALTANVVGDATQVQWTLFGPGSLSAASGPSTSYLTPPGLPVASATVTITATLGSVSAHAGIVVHARPVYLVGRMPLALAFDGHSVWVANFADYNVMKIRPEDGVIEATYGVGDTPMGLLFDGQAIWVANPNQGTLTKLRISDGATILTTPRVGVHPVSLAFDGESVWAHTDDGLAKVRASDGALIGSYAVPNAAGVGDVVFDGTDLWASGGQQVISRIRPTDGSVIADIWTGAPNSRLAVDRSSGRLWAVGSAGDPTQYWTDRVVQIDTQTGFVVASARAGAWCNTILFDGAHLWLANEYGTTVQRLSAATLEVQASYTMIGNPRALTFDGTRVWAASFDGALVMTF